MNLYLLFIPLTKTEHEVEDDIYDSEDVKIPLFENSDITVLQALASISISNQITFLGLTMKRTALLIIFCFLQNLTMSSSVCPNDCAFFRKTRRYDYSKLHKCPVCGSHQYFANKSARRRFIYFPLGSCWRRMYGNATISEVLQSHSYRVTLIKIKTCP